MEHTSRSLLVRLHDPNDKAAWLRFVELYTPFIRRWLNQRAAISPADADDLTQVVLQVVVTDLPAFRHNSQVGAFRNWLRTVTVNRLRDFWRTRRHRPQATGDCEAWEFLEQWADPNSELSRIWNQEHDQYVAERALEIIEPDFEAKTFAAFRLTVLEEVKPADAATELGISINAVLIAKSRVLKRLRQELAGMAEI